MVCFLPVGFGWCVAEVSSVSPSSEQTAICGFDEQRLIWYVFRLWNLVCS